MVSAALGLVLAWAWAWAGAGPEPVSPDDAPDPSAPVAAPVAAPTPADPPAPASAPAPAPAPDPTGVAPAGVATSVDLGTRPADTPVERDGPPFATEEDHAQLRQRFGLVPRPPTQARTARWKCLIADPVCGFNVELNATSAYALRARQGVITRANTMEWHSARAQYDLWVNFPVLVETQGRFRYTRITLGPKGGIIASDSGHLWGNVGFATRYWFGRGKFSPALEFTSALSFRLAGYDANTQSSTVERSPAGFTADIGLNIGGFGAIVIGGQYDSPMAREEIPEKLRVASAGMFFVGFRGNVLWGVPAALAIGTHIAANRGAGEDRTRIGN